MGFTMRIQLFARGILVLPQAVLAYHLLALSSWISAF
jgi:hypothetical protein